MKTITILDETYNTLVTFILNNIGMIEIGEYIWKIGDRRDIREANPDIYWLRISIFGLNKDFKYDTKEKRDKDYKLLLEAIENDNS